MNWTIKRNYQPDVTLGTLYNASGNEFCKTLELPFLDNQNKISCIPEGQYSYIKYNSPHLGRDVLLLQNVPNRSMCEIHNGNTVLDIQGCAVVGAKYGKMEIDGQVYDAVLNSKPTLDKVIAASVNSGTITITKE